jgi:hypothetical protein
MVVDDIFGSDVSFSPQEFQYYLGMFLTASRPLRLVAFGWYSEEILKKFAQGAQQTLHVLQYIIHGWQGLRFCW